MLPNALSIVDKTLLIGLAGLNRQMWRRRIRSLLYYRTALAAREFDEPAAQYLLQSFREWPLPETDAPRWKTATAWLVRTLGSFPRGSSVGGLDSAKG